ncbi:hypothetical protein ACGFIW_18285 [Micromonospora sp. NPDC048935]|uniref:hypothetical protein n=1 Tax=Micromonospora sp. NPDC048935 TaxID=3364262 RepID=UPI0037110EB3
MTVNETAEGLVSTEMMEMRRAALDAMADLPGQSPASPPFAGVRVDGGPFLAAAPSDRVPGALVAAIVDRLDRTVGREGCGAALVTGLSGVFDLAATRRFHEALFRAVWREIEPMVGAEVPGRGYRTKVNLTADGAIPLELYGSRWSFKQIHMDRDALLFSHCYGPVSGYDGGEVILADARSYLSRHRARFTDLFEWSEEPTPGSKPVLRAEHQSDVMAECGVNLGCLDSDQILFVNNLPSAGILHGATPVQVRDPANYLREFHRCSVRRLADGEDGDAAADVDGGSSR